MRWVQVVWLEAGLTDEPVIIYSELAEDGYEQRRVEVYVNGRELWANESGGTVPGGLAEKPVGELEEIRAASTEEAVFVALSITEGEFEHRWVEARSAT